MMDDLIISALSKIENYYAFERLCCDILSGDGYPTIEPLGGPGDKGRDAIYRDPKDPKNETIFAFSSSSSWRTKLREDCKKLKEMGFQPKKLVFVTNQDISGRKRNIESEIYKNFKFKLIIYDILRLRILLVGKMQNLIQIHTDIFPTVYQQLIPMSDQSIYLTEEEKKEKIASAPFIPFVLAGGKGTRVIHLSSGKEPKQLWYVYDRKSMLQNTISRLSSLEKDNSHPIYVLSIEKFKQQIEEQTKNINTKNWYEPEAKGTATAIAYAIKRSLHERLINQHSVVGFFPADHYIYDSDSEGTEFGTKKVQDLFKKTINNAKKIAKSRDAIVLLGLPPIGDDKKIINEGLNYGWIHVNNYFSDKNRYSVVDFIEKPTIEVAKSMLDERENYLWNSGIFIARAEIFLKAIMSFIPGTYLNIEFKPKDVNIVRSCNYNKIRRRRMFDDSVIENIVDSEKPGKVSLSAIETLFRWEDLGVIDNIIRHFERRSSFNNKDTTNYGLFNQESTGNFNVLDLDSVDKTILIQETNGEVRFGIVKKEKEDKSYPESYPEAKK